MLPSDRGRGRGISMVNWKWLHDELETGTGCWVPGIKLLVYVEDGVESFDLRLEQAPCPTRTVARVQNREMAQSFARRRALLLPPAVNE